MKYCLSSFVVHILFRSSSTIAWTGSSHLLSRLASKESFSSRPSILKMSTKAAAASSTMETKSSSYDLIVVGGGSAGLTAAKFATNTLKKSCLLVESEKLGGDCTWTGCVPSKSLLASAKAAQLVRKQAIISSSSSSLSSSTANMDWSQIQKRYREIQEEIYIKDDSPEALAKVGIETLSGKAIVLAPKTIQVTTTATKDAITKSFEAKQGIILCTGASPRPPESVIPGIQEIDFVTYEKVWDLETLPERLTVVGGGPISCELAQAFSRLGSKVTIVASTLLSREEPEVSDILKKVFEEEGIIVEPSRVEEVTRNSDGSHSAKTSSGEVVVGDMMLVSIGRVANSKGLGLENVGAEIDTASGGIKVNEKLETTCQGLYAAGDCTGEKQFTHYAGYQGAIAARNILLPLSDAGVLSDVPATTFTSPEVASLGYTEKEAREQLGNDIVRVSKMNLEDVDRALCEGQRHGILKIIHHKKNGKILGATIMAPSAGELISEIAVARSADMSFDALAKVIHPYPSYAMALQLMAADVYYEKTTNLLWLYNFLKWLGL